MQTAELPEAVVACILQHVPLQERLTSCALVCRTWATAAALVPADVDVRLKDCEHRRQLQLWLGKHAGVVVALTAVGKSGKRRCFNRGRTNAVKDYTESIQPFFLPLQLPTLQLTQLCSVDLSHLNLKLSAQGFSTACSSTRKYGIPTCAAPTSSSGKAALVLPQLHELLLEKCHVTLQLACQLLSATTLTALYWQDVKLYSDNLARQLKAGAPYASLWQHLQLLPNLKELQLLDKHTTAADIAGISKMQKLQHLHLDLPALLDAECEAGPWRLLSAMQHLTQLRHLQLRDCALYQAVPTGPSSEEEESSEGEEEEEVGEEGQEGEEGGAGEESEGEEEGERQESEMGVGSEGGEGSHGGVAPEGGDVGDGQAYSEGEEDSEDGGNSQGDAESEGGGSQGNVGCGVVVGSEGGDVFEGGGFHGDVESARLREGGALSDCGDESGAGGGSLVDVGSDGVVELEGDEGCRGAVGSEGGSEGDSEGSDGAEGALESEGGVSEGGVDSKSGGVWDGSDVSRDGEESESGDVSEFKPLAEYEWGSYKCFSTLTASTQLTALILEDHEELLPQEALHHMFPFGHVLPDLKVIRFSGSYLGGREYWQYCIDVPELALIAASCPALDEMVLEEVILDGVYPSKASPLPPGLQWDRGCRWVRPAAYEDLNSQLDSNSES